MKTRLLVIIAAFLVSLPWIQGLSVGINNEVMVDGLTTSSAIVIAITLIFSMISWGLFSWASKNISLSGVLFGIISGASMVIPFLQVLGPMTGVIVGVVAGFVAFMLQKKMLHPAKNKPLIVVTITFAATYSVLFIVVLSTQSSTMWDTGYGIGTWTGTTEGLEKWDMILFRNVELIFFPMIVISLIITGLIIRK